MLLKTSELFFDAVLRLEPNDVDARQTKLFLLLQTEQYNEALDLIDSNEDQSQHSYERGYSLYRLQRESDARNLLDTIKQERGGDDRGVIHLEAQLVSFRLIQMFTIILTLTSELS